MKAIVLQLLLLTVLVVPTRAGGDDKKPDPKKDDKKPAPKLPLGKETTYVMGPLDKDGYIDYEAALNAELSRGVTRDNNANALLITAFGPAPEGGDGLPVAYFKWLDINPPPRDGEYMVDISGFARQRLALTDNQLNAVYDHQGWASSRPWSAKDYPAIAEWLKFNEKPLAIVLEATKRTEYFNPLVSSHPDGERGSLIGALLPSVQKCRALASALTCRAMLKLEAGKVDEAWQDLLAAHRLGRLVARGATLIESLVGIAISAIAQNSTLAFIERAKLTPKQAMACLKDIENLPPFPPMADKINTGERFMGLDSLQLMRRGDMKNLRGFLDAEDLKALNAEDLKALETLDWDTAFRNVNKRYDEMSAALRVKDRVAREKAFDKLDEMWLARRKEIGNGDKIRELVKKQPGNKELGKEIALAVTDVLMALLTPAVRKLQGAHDRAEQLDRNLRVALAMAAYHADQGKYPAKLDDLAPKYIAKVPGDVFSGKPLIYKPSEKGYLFYSIGQNGIDEGGRYYDDEPRGDDPRVRMPLPPLKKGE